jgi:hypothetical protein
MEIREEEDKGDEGDERGGGIRLLRRRDTARLYLPSRRFVNFLSGGSGLNFERFWRDLTPRDQTLARVLISDNRRQETTPKES